MKKKAKNLLVLLVVMFSVLSSYGYFIIESDAKCCAYFWTTEVVNGEFVSVRNLQRCNLDLNFNADIGTCDYRELVDCGSREESPCDPLAI